MDLQDVKELKRLDASMWLELHQERERDSFIYWRLYANFNVFAKNGWRPVRLKVLENRFRHPIFTVLQNSELDFHEFRLPLSEIPVSPAKAFISATSEPKAATKPPCKRLCKICGKTSFKTPRRCANPQILDAKSGTWVCDLVRA